MKKAFLLLICLLVCCTAAFAQSVTLTFTAKDVANHYVQLNRVTITNLTKSWQETIYWPDTTLTMQNGTGIADVETCHGTSLQLSQNNPNPFTSTTEVSLTVAEEDEVMLDIADVNGKTVGTHRMRPQVGTHQFRITLSTAGTYVMTARQNGQTSSIKMVCNGGGDCNKIEYKGNDGNASHASSTQPKNAPKYTTTHPFNFGDQMEYVGYATINGSEVESQRISQPQGASQTFTLQFAEIDGSVITVITNLATEISYYSAICGGNVIYDGEENIIVRGICWNTLHNPTANHNHISCGSGVGSYNCNIYSLNPGTTYYVRAYATSVLGTVYGNEVEFATMPLTIPTVSTSAVTDITPFYANSGGTVIDDGGYFNETIRGVCWSTSQNPTISNSHTANGSGTGIFTSQLTGLNPGTTYYVRAYATNSAGTSYGEQQIFTTYTLIPCPGAATVTDIDNNTYNTVQIGNQCWMKENLRTTRYSNGTSIALGSSTSTTTAYRYYPNDDQSNVSTYGYLYNWKAVMGNSSSSSANPSGVQGICPTGWHVPSDAEWTQLTDYVSGQSQYVCGVSNSHIAKALASTTGWQSSSQICAVGNNPNANNATGFSVLPSEGGGYGDYAYFWSATEVGSFSAYCMGLAYDMPDVYRGGDLEIYKYLGFSVRCLRD